MTVDVRIYPMLKIGFDFDGVLVYNPARVLRLPVSLFKRRFIKQKRLKFWYPQQAWQKQFWILAHKSSIFPAKGYGRLQELLRTGKIKGYVITARYSFLEEDFQAWLNKYDPEQLFAGYFLNRLDKQPHKFKERMIKKLKLDYFVEDNWDIVKYLSRSLKSSSSKFKAQGSKQAQNPKTKIQNTLEPRASNLERGKAACRIHWIYNILDRGIDYPHKYPYLGKFLESL